jgi:hypothetical protein
MLTVDQLKAETAKLRPDEQFELFRWWVETDVFREKQLASLKTAIEVGIQDLDSGRFQEYDQNDLARLAGEVCDAGRERLSTARKRA